MPKCINLYLFNSDISLPEACFIIGEKLFFNRQDGNNPLKIHVFKLGSWSSNTVLNVLSNNIDIFIS